MYQFLRIIIDARKEQVMSPPPPPPPPYQPLPSPHAQQHVINDCHCIHACVCSRQPLNHLAQPAHYHTFQPPHHHGHHHSHGHHTILTLPSQPPRNTIYVRSSTFSPCRFLFFFVIISIIISAFWLTLPQLDSYGRRFERIRRRHEQGVTWTTPLKGSCLRSGVRKYSATLLNYQVDNYWKEACETTELYIHGREVYPQRCELTSFLFGFVIGHWEINFDEPDCTPVWTSLEDEGCVGSNERRFSARLLNVDQPDQWDVMCAITPVDIQGESRMTHFCENQGILGMRGYWNTFDETCKTF